MQFNVIIMLSSIFFIDGYVSVQRILDHPRFRSSCGNLSFDDLEYIVETSDRQYFNMIKVDSEWKIKALHGHTVQV